MALLDDWPLPYQWYKEYFEMEFKEFDYYLWYYDIKLDAKSWPIIPKNLICKACKQNSLYPQGRWYLRTHSSFWSGNILNTFHIAPV